MSYMQQAPERFDMGFNEAGAWEPRMSPYQDVDLVPYYSSFNEAGAWEPRMR